jgi:hypothetical protein
MSLNIEDKNALVSLAVDISRNNDVSTKFSKDETLTALHNALVKANNGKTYFDIRDIQNNKCVGLFEIVEEIIAQTEDDQLLNHPLWNEIVDYKNVALGDKNSFYIPDDSDLYVSRIADGTTGAIRQRLSGGRNIEVQTHTYEVKIYDELSRVLAGRSDIDEFIKKVSKAFAKKKIDLILDAFLNITQTNPANIFLASSTGFDETELLDLCLKVEAKNGTMPIILGTKKALRNITLDSTTLAELGKNDLYTMGYYGRFNGYTCIHIPNVLKSDNKTFYLPDDTLYVIGTAEDKPVKFVTEGTPMVFTSEIHRNVDLSQDFMTIEKFGCDIILAGKKNGVYQIA